MEMKSSRRLARGGSAHDKSSSMSSSSASTSVPSSASGTSSSASNISYTLYLYREELRRRNARFLRLSHTKFRLTDKLISKNVRNLHACSVEDLQHINRGLMFRTELKQQIKRLHQLHELGLSNFNPNAMSTDL